MTLEEYKRQSKRLSEEIQNFTGSPAESAKFFEGLAKKYPYVIEFNARAAKCKDIGEFKTLADSFGMVFSSDESAERLFSLLLDGTKRIEKLVEEMKNGAELGDDFLAGVAAGTGVLDGFVGSLHDWLVDHPWLVPLNMEGAGAGKMIKLDIT